MARFRPGVETSNALQGGIRGNTGGFVEQENAVDHGDYVRIVQIDRIGWSGLFAIHVYGLRGDGIVDQVRQSYAALDRLVMDKVELRDNPKFEALGQLGTQESGCMLQTGGGLGNGLRAAKGGKKYLCMMVIAADFDTGERDHADPRILDFDPDQLGEILLNLIADSGKPGGIFRHLLSRREFESGTGRDPMAHIQSR
jgi:hypothetical protein